MTDPGDRKELIEAATLRYNGFEIDGQEYRALLAKFGLSATEIAEAMLVSPRNVGPDQL